LKATNGWNSNGNGNGNGEDTYGFAALPGGFGSSGGRFFSVGYNGHWWSASEDNDSYGASLRDMDYYGEIARWGSDVKTNLYSVRCAQD
jgi:uncharacterized protein (TIGR02145 family)